MTPNIDYMTREQQLEVELALEEWAELGVLSVATQIRLTNLGINAADLAEAFTNEEF